MMKEHCQLMTDVHAVEQQMYLEVHLVVEQQLMVEYPLDVHDEVKLTEENQQFACYPVDHVEEAKQSIICLFSNAIRNISMLTGDFGRAKTPTIATVKVSYFPLMITESVGIYIYIERWFVFD
jgi:hypothetical protein